MGQFFCFIATHSTKYGTTPFKCSYINGNYQAKVLLRRNTRDFDPSGLLCYFILCFRRSNTCVDSLLANTHPTACRWSIHFRRLPKVLVRVWSRRHLLALSIGESPKYITRDEAMTRRVAITRSFKVRLLFQPRRPYHSLNQLSFT